MRVLATVAIVLAMSGAACGGGDKSPSAPTPTPTPIAPAMLVAPASAVVSVSGCNPTLAALMGLSVVSCPQFSGTIQNTGTGCAANVRGTTVALNSANQQVGSAGWTYALTVRPGEQFAYSGGPLTIPTGSWTYTTSPSWDNVRCP